MVRGYRVPDWRLVVAERERLTSMVFTILLLTTMTDARGDQSKPPLLENERAFEGAWRLVANSQGRPVLPPEGQDDPQLDTRWMIVKNGVWLSKHEGGTIFPLTIRRKAARPWPLIDRTENLMTQPVPGALVVAGGGMIVRTRGIYLREGDKLTIVIGPWADPPPSSLAPAPGRNVEIWRRVSR